MAEVVELNTEEMIDELQLMERFQIFSKEELKTIKKYRKQFDYKLQRVTKNKGDLLKYVQYEMSLLKILKQRIAEKGLQGKKNNIEYLVFTRINRLFQTGIRRFPQDVKLWLTFIKFCKQVGYYTHVSRLLEQMLELHGGNKPSLFRFAVQWEWDDNHSIERARRFIHQGLHLHKESEMLFAEGFRLELAFANTKREEAREKGNLQSREAEDPILSGQLADVIYESAIKKIIDVTFLAQLLKIAEQYPWATRIQEKIIMEMKTRFPTEEVTWDTLAKRELEKEGNVRQRMEKCISMYQKGVETIQTQKMWDLYLDYILKINEDMSTLSKFRKNCLKSAFDAAHVANKLSEEHYLTWSKKVEDSERGQVLEWGIGRYPDSGKLWASTLRYHLGKNDQNAVESIFFRIKANSNISDPVNLWLIFLKYYQITDPVKVESVWLEGSNHPAVGALLKGRYIEWLSVRKGIIAARKAYKMLSCIPPFSLDLHIAMSKLEEAQPKLSLSSARMVYENAVRQYGKDNTDVWMLYVRFEEKYGDARNVPMLYERATKNLGPHLVNGFVSEYNLNKADQANRLLSSLERSVFHELPISSFRHTNDPSTETVYIDS